MALRLPFSSAVETQAGLLHPRRCPSKPLSPPSLLALPAASPRHRLRYRPPRRLRPAFSVDQEETEPRVSGEEKEEGVETEEEEQEEADASPEDLEYIAQIKRVLELLKKNRDMLFGEVKLTIMIEDPRDIERKILLGIEDPDEVTRDDLADALEDVYEGRIPKNRVALRLLAEEMIQWPDLEVEAPKNKPGRSLYAKVTDTGVDPREAARRLNIDWDSAADIDSEGEPDEVEVPPAVGYGALYLVTGLPILIGVSVVLILFYNSLQ